MFLARITNELKIPVLGLVDSDPYGLKILSVYMSGSKNMSYDSASLTTPDIMWLGLRPSDYGKYNLPEQCLLDMTENDIKTGHELMKEDFIMKNPKWMKELEIMVRLGDALFLFGEGKLKVPKSLPSTLHLVRLGQNKEEGRNSGLVVVWFPVPHRRVLAAKVARRRLDLRTVKACTDTIARVAACKVQFPQGPQGIFSSLTSYIVSSKIFRNIDNLGTYEDRRDYSNRHKSSNTHTIFIISIECSVVAYYSVSLTTRHNQSIGIDILSPNLGSLG
jgi:hypothetical protein